MIHRGHGVQGGATEAIAGIHIGTGPQQDLHDLGVAIGPGDGPWLECPEVFGP